jgi:hypothetical protein
MEYKVLLEKLTGPQLVKKFPGLSVSRGFINSFPRARHLSIFWARLTHSMNPFHFLKNCFNIMLTYMPESSKSSPAPGHPTKILNAPLLSLYVPHAPSISFFLIFFPTWYLVRSTDYKALRYEVFSILLLPLSSYTKISSSESNPRTPSTCIPPSNWQTEFHSHTKQQAK